MNARAVVRTRGRLILGIAIAAVMIAALACGRGSTEAKTATPTTPIATVIAEATPSGPSAPEPTLTDASPTTTAAPAVSSEVPPIGKPALISVEPSASPEPGVKNTAAGEPAAPVGPSGSGTISAAPSQPPVPTLYGNGGREVSSAGAGVPVVTAQPVSAVVQQGSASYYPAPGVGQQAGIWVQGVGSLTLAPDVARLTIGVEAREPTVSAARTAAAEAMQAVFDAVKAQGVAEDDIVTTSFRISPQTVWTEVRDKAGSYNVPKIVGYIVSNSVRVTIRDLDSVGNVVDAAAEQAGDLVRIDAISFAIDDPSQYAEKLRQMAAADALAKARIYADAMGVPLGQLVYLTETGSSAPVVAEQARFEKALTASAPAPTVISSGDMTLSTQIQVVFAIGSS